MKLYYRFTLLQVLCSMICFSLGYRTIPKFENYRLRNILFVNLNEDNKLDPTVSSIQQHSISNTKQIYGTISMLLLPFLAVGKSFADDLGSYTDSLAVMIEARAIIKPTDVFIEYQAYDNARTNCKYVLNQLQFQKNVKNLIQQSIDFCDDMSIIEEAQEAGNRITNTLIQYDSSVYTCIFIPSDDGSVPPSAIKYRNEAANYYKSFDKDISTLLQLANDKQLETATSKANAALSSMPNVLFKSVSPKIIGSQNN